MSSKPNYYEGLTIYRKILSEMKYLLYYNLDNNFIADQTSVGGDGTKVVSVVNGVAYSNDQKKAYYRFANNDSENLTSYTVTVHYRTSLGVQLAPDDTFVVDAYVGKGVKKVVEPKIIDGYNTTYGIQTINVYGNTEYTFRYWEMPKNPEEPLTFNIISAGTIYWKASNSNYCKTIQYKKNGGDWTDITSNTGGGASISVGAGDAVQFRGDNATYSSGYSYYNSFSTSTNTKFEVEGNIMSLIDSTGYTTATTLASSSTFYQLFYGCTGLTSAENLVLPATTLAVSCYTNMFYACISLTTAPELPVTTLANGCYSYMFQGCTSLTTAPVLLPDTILAPSCYFGMFSGCRSLRTAPALPATTLAKNCYESMFGNCRSLTTAPALPATTLAQECYQYMFSNCTSLTTAPELPATTLAYRCYGSMFLKCSSLRTAPELPATTLVTACYAGMFGGCTGLRTAPELPATRLIYDCYLGMFGGCTSLTTAPELPATTLASSCYSGMFSGCRSLRTAPALPATTLDDRCYHSMFSGCTNLNYIKCLATNISARNCTDNWVQGVSSSGTFVKNPNMSYWSTGANGIPTNWTVQNA